MGSLRNYVIVAILMLIGISGYHQYIFAQSSGQTFYISPNGSDSNSGSLSQPFQTIQKGLNLAQPGDTIQLGSGVYFQDAVTVRDGREGSYITVVGPADAVVKGAGSAHIFEVNHDYHSFQGFTIDGLHGDSGSASGYRDKLLFVQGKQTRSGVTKLVVKNMHFKNAGGECLRLRYFVTDSEIAYSDFQNCGVHDFQFNGGGKNGEAIYIGTATDQWGDGKNPTSDPDESNNNFVHHNTMNTQGNECVDIKEGSSYNIVEFNECTGQKDPNSAGFDSRGDWNTFRNNVSSNNVGAGVRLGGSIVSGREYGQNNSVYYNTLSSNQVGGIKFQVIPQQQVCGNTFANNSGGVSVGTYGSQFNPAGSCPDNASPSPSASPSTSPSVSPSPSTQTSPSSSPTASPSPSPSSSPSADPTISPTPSAAPAPKSVAMSLNDEATVQCSGSLLLPTSWQNAGSILNFECLNSSATTTDLSVGTSIVYQCPEGLVLNTLSTDLTEVDTLCFLNVFPSGQPSASPSTNPSGNSLHFGFQLQGLSKAGISQEIEVTLHASGSAEQKIKHTFTTDAYGVLQSDQNGVDIPSNINPGQLVTVYAKAPWSLRKRVGEVVVSAGQNHAPEQWLSEKLLVGDFVATPRDNVINLQDVASVLAVYTELSVNPNADTQKFDVNYDNKIDLLDVALVLSNYTALEVVGE